MRQELKEGESLEVELGLPAEVIQAVWEITEALRRATEALDLPAEFLTEFLQRPIEIGKGLLGLLGLGGGVSGELDVSAPGAVDVHVPIQFHGGSPPSGVSGSPPRLTEEESRLYPSSGGRHRPRSAAALQRLIARLEVQLRRARSHEERALARCKIAGAPLPPDPPGQGKRYRETWERAVRRHREVAARLEVARADLAKAEGPAPVQEEQGSHAI